MSPGKTEIRPPPERAATEGPQAGQIAAQMLSGAWGSSSLGPCPPPPPIPEAYRARAFAAGGWFGAPQGVGVPGSSGEGPQGHGWASASDVALEKPQDIGSFQKNPAKPRLSYPSLRGTIRPPRPL